IPCPKCGSRLPRGARFCGDCGASLAGAAGGAPAAVHPTRVATAALPDPIPPLDTTAVTKPASGPAQPVLPPFRAANWPQQPAPQAKQAEEVSDEAPTRLLNEAA